jgi:hypothetical protein
LHAILTSADRHGAGLYWVNGSTCHWRPTFTITPAKDDNPLNGVTTYDLVLISKHILGIEPLGSPIQNDCCGRQQIQFDHDVRHCGDSQTDPGYLPGAANNTSWRFVDKLKGFQFTATLNGLKAVDVVKGDNVTENNFNLLPENAMAVSIDGAQEFTVRFRAEKAGKLSAMLGVSGSITRAEAYQVNDSMTNDAMTRLGIAFRFSGKTISGVGFELYQNQPNPFVNKTSIGFFLPEAAEATLTVFDETGRMVYQQNGWYAKGENMVVLDRALLNTTGVLYYKLETATDSATRKMVQAK